MGMTKVKKWTIELAVVTALTFGTLSGAASSLEASRPRPHSMGCMIACPQPYIQALAGLTSLDVAAALPARGPKF
jgi:hypothetical protein